MPLKDFERSDGAATSSDKRSERRPLQGQGTRGYLNLFYYDCSKCRVVQQFFPLPRKWAYNPCFKVLNNDAFYH